MVDKRSEIVWLQRVQDVEEVDPFRQPALAGKVWKVCDNIAFLDDLGIEILDAQFVIARNLELLGSLPP